MANPTIEELHCENEELRALLVSLSAALLRKIAVSHFYADDATSADAQRLVIEAEQCFRCARIPKLKQEIAQGLESAGNELLAKAVQIETCLQRRKQKK